MIASINKQSYPQTLIVILGPDKGMSRYEANHDVTRVSNEDGDLIGYNFFKVDQILPYDQLPNGQVQLTEDQVAQLNQKITVAGFTETMKQSKPTVVYGYVENCEAHPDSDHLQVTRVAVGLAHDVQIVCGAPNIAQGQKVVVALPGTLMPDGKQIWINTLRGVASFGMICAAREFKLPHAPQKRGIMVVPDTFKVGDAFEPTKCDELIASGIIKL